MSATEAAALYRAERAKRPLPPEPECPYEKDDARYRWRLRQQRRAQSGWSEYHISAEERHTVALRIAFTGWVE